MNIVVCIKQAPDTEARIQPKEGTPGIVRDGVKLDISPYDEFALEAALRLKEQHGGTVTVLALGPDRAKEALRKGLSVGADKAVLVSDAGLAGADGHGVAAALAKAAGRLGADVVLVGKKAVGVDRGQVGVQVAQRLGLPFVSQVAVLESADAKSVRVEREIEGGREVLEIDLPAVIAVDKTSNELRHAGLKGIMAAKTKPIETLSLEALGLTADEVKPRVRVTATAPPPQRQAGRIVAGDAATAAKELVRLLREEAKVI